MLSIVGKHIRSNDAKLSKEERNDGQLENHAHHETWQTYRHPKVVKFDHFKIWIMNHLPSSQEPIPYPYNVLQ